MEKASSMTEAIQPMHSIIVHIEGWSEITLIRNKAPIAKMHEAPLSFFYRHNK